MVHMKIYISYFTHSNVNYEDSIYVTYVIHSYIHLYESCSNTPS